MSDEIDVFAVFARPNETLDVRVFADVQGYREVGEALAVGRAEIVLVQVRFARRRGRSLVKRAVRR